MFKKFLLGLVVAVAPLTSFAQTISLDQDNIVVHLKNNSTNVLKFPFIIQKAELTTETPDDFSVNSKNYAVIVIPTAEYPNKEESDLLIWSAEGDPYLVKLKTDGKKEQNFVLASNKIQSTVDIKAHKFETGKIESDIKRIMKKLVLGKKVPGYKKVDVKKKFQTPDLEMQKEFFYDGGKYRAEQWYIKNKTDSTLYLEYENFYAPGMLAIAFEKQTLDPHKITKAWIIVDKHTIYQRINKNK